MEVLGGSKSSSRRPWERSRRHSHYWCSFLSNMRSWGNGVWRSSSRQIRKVTRRRVTFCFSLDVSLSVVSFSFFFSFMVVVVVVVVVVVPTSEGRKDHLEEKVEKLGLVTSFRSTVKRSKICTTTATTTRTVLKQRDIVHSY